MWKPFVKVVDREMDEIELSSKLANLLGDIESVEIVTEAQKQIFKDLAGVDGLLDYLRDTLVNDMKRYFGAQSEKERDIIRGGFSRTAYIRSRILDSIKNS